MHLSKVGFSMFLLYVSMLKMFNLVPVKKKKVVHTHTHTTLGLKCSITMLSLAEAVHCIWKNTSQGTH